MNTFNSFLMGGFECSTHRRRDGRRLDLIDATGHSRFAAEDYRQLAGHGLYTLRDGLRWHLIDRGGHFDWSSFLPMLHSAREAGVEVIWDLCHYGWPDDIDIWRPEFVDRFAVFAAAAARLIAQESGAAPLICPINEISYWAWAGGEVGRMHPLARGRGSELKIQLVRAAVAASAAIRQVEPRARLVHTDPLIRVIPSRRAKASRRARAHAHHRAQFEAFDMMAGRLLPELGGSPELLDIVGVNYYPENQWIHGGRTIPLGHPSYKPLRELLSECFARHGRPILVSETGAEGANQTAWLRYVVTELKAAAAGGVPLVGACLYPITHYPGWDDDRPCVCGLLGGVGAAGGRAINSELADELRYLLADAWWNGAATNRREPWEAG